MPLCPPFRGRRPKERARERERERERARAHTTRPQLRHRRRLVGCVLQPKAAFYGVKEAMGMVDASLLYPGLRIAAGPL